MKCREINCKQEAKYEAETVFGKSYYCKKHANKKRDNLCVRNIKILSKTI